MTTHREVAAELLQLALDTPPAVHGDATERLLDALREWSGARSEIDDRQEPAVRALELLLVAADAARVDTRSGGVQWMAAVVRRLATCQSVCGDAWREIPVGRALERMADLAVDLGGFAVWGWEGLERPDALLSPAVGDALCRAARAAAESHALLCEAINALDAAAGEWTVEGKEAGT